MDTLDRVSIWAMVLLIIAATALMSYHGSEARGGREFVPKVVEPSELEVKLKEARKFLEAGNLGKAEAMALALKARYPYEGGPFMLMGDIHWRRQEPLEAVYEYRKAVDLNPDYLDKKTPLFQGRKLKMVVQEAEARVRVQLRQSPQDKGLKEALKVIYYLRRRIAGGCG
jgi:predicted Zn-dependent protease